MYPEQPSLDGYGVESGMNETGVGVPLTVNAVGVVAAITMGETLRAKKKREEWNKTGFSINCRRRSIPMYCTDYLVCCVSTALQPPLPGIDGPGALGRNEV